VEPRTERPHGRKESVKSSLANKGTRKAENAAGRQSGTTLQSFCFCVLGEKGRMFDIHYHLIFGVDDGPRTIEASLKLAEASIAEGVTHVVATPHASYKYPYRTEVNREHLAELNQRLGGRLMLGLGCDFHLSYENLSELDKTPKTFTINGSNYLLVEFPDHFNPAMYGDVFFRIMNMGITPIVTHPERNPTLLQSPTPIIDWVHSGCLMQITASSLTGRFGSRSETLSRLLLKGNYVHIIASDAHDLDSRSPGMGKAFGVLKRDFGVETAQRLCIDNPKAIFFGERMPEQPEAFGPLYERRPPQKKSFLGRLFG
jgi:protein-tyrosine phosphatase